MTRDLQRPAVLLHIPFGDGEPKPGPVLPGGEERLADRGQDRFGYAGSGITDLDHDLGACPECTARGRHVGRMTRPGNTFYDYCRHVPSGYDLCLWMEQTGRWPRGSVSVHSANPTGARRMLAVIERGRRRASSATGSVRMGGATNSSGRAGSGLGGWTAVLKRMWTQVEAVLGRNRTSARS